MEACQSLQAHRFTLSALEALMCHERLDYLDSFITSSVLPRIKIMTAHEVSGVVIVLLDKVQLFRIEFIVGKMRGIGLHLSSLTRWRSIGIQSRSFIRFGLSLAVRVRPESSQGVTSFFPVILVVNFESECHEKLEFTTITALQELLLLGSVWWFCLGDVAYVLGLRLLSKSVVVPFGLRSRP